MGTLTPEATVQAPGGVGPNAVIQLGLSLRALAGEAEASAVFQAAGQAVLLDATPRGMVDQCVVSDLFDALWRIRPEDAGLIAQDAGLRTAEYIAQNRILAIARSVLGLVSPRLSVRLLMATIRRNAWTFCGSGACAVTTSPRRLISIRDKPIAMPDCAWHQAVLERQFRKLVSDTPRVRHRDCCRDNRLACTFEITLGDE